MLQKQRRVSRKIDPQMADNLIVSKGLETELYKTIQIIDEDALMAALYEGKLTEEEVDLMYPQKIVWALILNKR
jgi:predicted RNA-binding protein associated with RNAse of E/G family